MIETIGSIVYVISFIALVFWTFYVIDEESGWRKYLHGVWLGICFWWLLGAVACVGVLLWALASMLVWPSLREYLPFLVIVGAGLMTAFAIHDLSKAWRKRTH